MSIALSGLRFAEDAPTPTTTGLVRRGTPATVRRDPIVAVPSSIDRDALGATAASVEPARDRTNAYQELELSFRLDAGKVHIDVLAAASKSILRTITMAAPGHAPNAGAVVDTRA